MQPELYHVDYDGEKREEREREGGGGGSFMIRERKITLPER